jgi:hypothetical protein
MAPSGPAREWQALADVTADVDVRISEDQKARARRVVGGHPSVESREVAEDLWMMLGVHPSQTDDLDFLIAPVAPLNRSCTPPRVLQ